MSTKIISMFAAATFAAADDEVPPPFCHDNEDGFAYCEQFNSWSSPRRACGEETNNNGGKWDSNYCKFDFHSGECYFNCLPATENCNIGGSVPQSNDYCDGLTKDQCGLAGDATGDHPCGCFEGKKFMWGFDWRNPDFVPAANTRYWLDFGEPGNPTCANGECREGSCTSVPFGIQYNPCFPNSCRDCEYQEQLTRYFCHIYGWWHCSELGFNQCDSALSIDDPDYDIYAGQGFCAGYTGTDECTRWDYWNCAM